MNGQWIGGFKVDYPEGLSGPPEGRVTVDIDEARSCYVGVAHIDYPSGDWPHLPSMDVAFVTDGKGGAVSFQSTEVVVVNRENGTLQHWDEVKHQYPDVQVSAEIQGQLERKGKQLFAKWSSGLGVGGSASLPESKAAEPSDLVARTLDWEGFRQFVGSFEGGRRLFRGQKAPWRLRTSYHREGRANVLRYLFEEVPFAHRMLSARTKHFFNINDHAQLWAFLSLIQHHGFPTPLLDWSYSPFVAAFFAFQRVSAKEVEDDGKARIFVFDQERWRSELAQISHPVPRFPHVSIIEPVALENDRFVSQQAAITSTNIDDVETYITQAAAMAGRQPYLTAVDIPWSERGRVMGELQYMGITSGSLFPGLDGACEELKERNFRLI